MHVRTMQHQDVQALAILCRELGYPSSYEELKTRFERISISQADALLVAEREGEVLGFIQVQERWVIESGRNAEIVALSVASPARRLGLGRSLVEAAQTWALARGFVALRVRSNIQRIESHQFYPSLGFRQVKTQHVYELRFEDSV